MRFKTLLFLCGFVLVSQACVDPSFDDSANDKTDTGSSNEFLDSRLNFSISADKSSYVPGEIAYFSVSAENISDETVVVFLSSSCNPAIGVYVDTLHNGYMGLTNLQDKPCNLGNIGQEMIGPGEVITRDVTWNIMIGDDIDAPSGVFEVAAEIALSDGAYNQIGKVVTSTAVVVTSGQRYLTRGEALATAYQQNSIADWYAANQFEKKCIMDNQMMARFEPNGKVTFAATSALADGTATIPGCSAQLIEGPIWRVVFFSKFGTSPGDYKVDINAVSGSLLELSSELK